MLLLSAIDGGHIVCPGVEFAFKVTVLITEFAEESKHLHQTYLLAPDYLYRSDDCLKWIDRQSGPRCRACQSVNDTSDDEYAAAPMDLRRIPHNQSY